MTRLTDEQAAILQEVCEREHIGNILRALLDERRELLAERDEARFLYRTRMGDADLRRLKAEAERDALRDQLTHQRAEVLDEVIAMVEAYHGPDYVVARLREMKAQPTSGSE